MRAGARASTTQPVFVAEIFSNAMGPSLHLQLASPIADVGYYLRALQNEAGHAVAVYAGGAA
jgi:hypothetical protein